MSLHSVVRSVQAVVSMSDDVLINMLTDFISRHANCTQEQIGEWLIDMHEQAQAQSNEDAAGV